jgi:GNAT superfamily N-acetyltransferase
MCMGNVEDQEALVRRATLVDLEALVALRLALFCDLGEAASLEEASALAGAVRAYIAQELPAERFCAWVAEAQGVGELVACGGLIFVQKPPVPSNPSGREAYIMNMYTRPRWRGRGLAGQIVAGLCAFARERDVHYVRLHASPAGRAVYERAGFVPITTEMLVRR